MQKIASLHEYMHKKTEARKQIASPCRLLQIAVFPADTFSKIISNACNAHQSNDQKQSRDHKDPPGTGQQRFFW